MTHEEIKRSFIKSALRELGRSTRFNHCKEQLHHRIFGMFLAASDMNALTDDLTQIEIASTRIWLWAPVLPEREPSL